MWQPQCGVVGHREAPSSDVMAAEGFTVEFQKLSVFKCHLWSKFLTLMRPELFVYLLMLEKDAKRDLY